MSGRGFAWGAALLVMLGCARSDPCPSGTHRLSAEDRCSPDVNEPADAGPVTRVPDPADPAKSGAPGAIGIPDAGASRADPVPGGTSSEAGRAAPPPASPPPTPTREPVDTASLSRCACGVAPRLDEAWHDVAPAGDAAGAASVAAVSVNPGGLSLFWTDARGAVRGVYRDPRVGQAWHGPFEFAPAGAAVAGAAPAAVAPRPGATALYWIGGDGSVRGTYYDPLAAEPRWVDWFPLSAPGMADPRGSVAALTMRDGSTWLFWVGREGAVWSSDYDVSQPAPGWSAPEQLAPGGAAAAPRLAAASSDDRVMQLFWVAPDGAIGSTYRDARRGSASWQPPFALTPPGEASDGCAPSAVSAVAGGLDVFWPDRRGALRRVDFDPREARPAWRGPRTLTSEADPVRCDLAAAVALPGAASVLWPARGGTLHVTCSTLDAPACSGGNWPASLASADALAGPIAAVPLREAPGRLGLAQVLADGRVRVASYRVDP